MESTSIKIDSASYVRPIINLISDIMREYGYLYFGPQLQTMIFLLVSAELVSGIKYHISGNSVRLITQANLNANYGTVVYGFGMIVVYCDCPT